MKDPLNRDRFDQGAELIEVILVKCVRGEGTSEDPVRIVDKYYSLDGAFLAEFDHILPEPAKS